MPPAAQATRSAFLAGVVLGCHHTPPPAPGSTAPSTAPVAESRPLASAPVPQPGPPIPATADPLCELTVSELDARHDASPVKLGDVLATTPLVTVVVPVLDEPDCSGIGWRHLAFAPFDGQATGGLIRAYRAQHLPAPVPERAPFYLMGGTFDAAHVVDLKKVCVSFKSEVNARVDWVLPLRDPEEAAAWKARLSGKVCGRENPACRGCERGDPHCCN